MCKKTLEIWGGITLLVCGCNLASILFLSMLVYITSLAITGLNTERSCNIIRAKEIIIADCASKGLNLNVPQDLGERLQVLNLSRNNIVNISDNSFNKYKDSLTTLDMSFLKERSNLTKDCYFEYSIETFSSLYKLEYLDLTNACWNRKFILPSKIRILRIENCSSVFNISYLNFLEEFHAAGNEWDCSPVFHKLAPLKYVDLRRNALLIFELERIAPFCDMRVLRLDAFPSKSLDKELHTEVTYCTCRAIDYWLTNTKVEHDHWNCIPPKNVGFAPICDLIPDEEILKLRRMCLAKKINEFLVSSLTWWMIPSAVVIMIGLLISALITNGVKKAMKRARERADEEEEEED